MKACGRSLPQPQATCPIVLSALSIYNIPDTTPAQLSVYCDDDVIVARILDTTHENIWVVYPQPSNRSDDMYGRSGTSDRMQRADDCARYNKQKDGLGSNK